MESTFWAVNVAGIDAAALSQAISWVPIWFARQQKYPEPTSWLVAFHRTHELSAQNGSACRVSRQLEPVDVSNSSSDQCSD